MAKAGELVVYINTSYRSPQFPVTMTHSYPSLTLIWYYILLHSSRVIFWNFYETFKILTWQWHPFYLCENGCFSISLVDSKHCRQGVLCTLSEAKFPSLGLQKVFWHRLHGCALFFFTASSLVFPSLPPVLQCSLCIFQILLVNPLTSSCYFRVPNLDKVVPGLPIQAFVCLFTVSLLFVLSMSWPISLWRALFVLVPLPGNKLIDEAAQWPALLCLLPHSLRVQSKWKCYARLLVCSL